MLLSLVIEKVTGLSYWDYVDKEVLQTCGAYYFVLPQIIMPTATSVR